MLHRLGDSCVNSVCDDVHLALHFVCIIVVFAYFVYLDHPARGLISAEKLSHKHNNEDLSHLQ